MGGVFHETFLSCITFEVYMFKVSNLLCWKEESLIKTARDVKLMLDAGRVWKTEAMPG